jgi:NRPS condensation-like uncharacterized protein
MDDGSLSGETMKKNRNSVRTSVQIDFRKLLLPSKSESFISNTPTQKPKCEHVDKYFIFHMAVKLGR